MVPRLIDAIKNDPDLSGQVVYHRLISARKVATQSVSGGLPRPLAEALNRQGIKVLYTHQAQALESARGGKNIVITTPTASGKTMCYNVPVIEKILRGEEDYSLYLFPIKALGQDQLKVIRDLGLGKSVRAEIYDGDTPSHRRSKIRKEPPHILISNPDMLHLSMLAYHDKWEHWFRKLKTVVLDELHTYKGVFGSHVGGVMRRLRRVAAHYGSKPQFIASSATIANPGRLANMLTGLDFDVIDENGAPAGERHFVFMDPFASPYTLAAKLFVLSISHGLKTIAFTKSRVITELMHTWTIDMAPELKRRISNYRAGFLPKERREIEARLFSGELDGVISTSALEVGVDIGGLDVCVLVGYPGTVVNTWQRGGRAGRGLDPSGVILVAGRDALDQYFMRHPADFFDRSVENAVADASNTYILGDHLVCAAAEIPLDTDEEIFDLETAQKALSEETKNGRLIERASESGWISASRKPQRTVDIRSVGESYTIFDEDGQNIIGTVSGERALSETHPGAIYLHRGKQHLIKSLDLDERNAYARPTRASYYTKALSDKETEILEVLRSRPTANFVVRLGRLKVTEQITGFEKRKTSTREKLSVHALDLPPRTFETVGLWWEMDDFIPKRLKSRGLDYMGGIHATEHAAIALFPLFAMCDRDDVGGISYPLHPQVGKGAVFVYDGYPGGVGLTERAFEVIEELLEKTLELIRACECETGCPSCIHSPKCGSGNVPLDKLAAVMVLEMLLDPEAIAGQSRIKEKPIKIAEKKPARDPDSYRMVVFDLETQRSAEEVGGWHNAHLMRVSVGVTWDSIDRKFDVYCEKDIDRLIEKLKQADLVVGFNQKRFDYRVLSAYTQIDLAALSSFDILAEIYNLLGFRLSLDQLASTTLGKPKIADGLQALQWWKEGKVEEIIEYCTADVEVTRDLFYYGIKHGFLCYEKRPHGKVKLPVDWKPAELIEQTKK